MHDLTKKTSRILKQMGLVKRFRGEVLPKSFAKRELVHEIKNEKFQARDLSRKKEKKTCHQYINSKYSLNYFFI